MTKPPRKGSFEELIARGGGRSRRDRPRMKLEDVIASVPVRDRTADQFGLRAASSIEAAEEQAFPFLRRCRMLLRRRDRQ